MSAPTAKFDLLDFLTLANSAVQPFLKHVVHQWPSSEYSPFLFKTLVYSLIGVRVLTCQKENPLWTVVMTNDGGLDKNRTLVPA